MSSARVRASLRSPRAYLKSLMIFRNVASFIQGLSEWNVPAIPISYEHDGFCMMVLQDHTEQDLNNLRDIVEQLTTTHLKMSVGLDITRLVDD